MARNRERFVDEYAVELTQSELVVSFQLSVDFQSDDEADGTQATGGGDSTVTIRSEFATTTADEVEDEEDGAIERQLVNPVEIVVFGRDDQQQSSYYAGTTTIAINTSQEEPPPDSRLIGDSTFVQDDTIESQLINVTTIAQDEMESRFVNVSTLNDEPLESRLINTPLTILDEAPESIASPITMINDESIDNTSTVVRGESPESRLINVSTIGQQDDDEIESHLINAAAVVQGGDVLESRLIDEELIDLLADGIESRVIDGAATVGTNDAISSLLMATHHDDRVSEPVSDFVQELQDENCGGGDK